MTRRREPREALHHSPLANVAGNRVVAAFCVLGAGVLVVFAVIAWTHVPGMYELVVQSRKGVLELGVVPALPAALLFTGGAVLTLVCGALCLGAHRWGIALAWVAVLSYLAWAAPLLALVMDAGSGVYGVILFAVLGLFPMVLAVAAVQLRRNALRGITG